MAGGWTRLTTLATAGLVWASAVLAEIPALPSERAEREIRVVVDRGVTHTRQLPTSSLRRLRKAMVGGVAMHPDDLRQLAEHRDGLAAMRYSKLLLAQGSAARTSDIAYFASIAAGTGRHWLLDDMIDALHRLDPENEPAARVKQYVRVLYGYGWAGNVLALDAMIRLNGKGRLFGPMSEATRDKLLAMGADGDGRIELTLAIRELQEPELDSAALQRIINLLQRAEAHATRGGKPALATMAQGMRSTTDATLRGISVN